MDSAEGIDVLVVCLAPTIQRTMVFERFTAGQVNRARETLIDASGKGVNAARVLIQDGGSSIHLTHCGGEHAELFNQLCQATGFRLEAIACASEIRTCTTLIDLASGQVSELVEECPSVPPTTWRLLKDRFIHLLEGVSAVLLSGKPASGYPEEALPELARLTSQAGKHLILDIRGRALVEALPFSPSLCKPNLSEFKESYGLLGIAEGMDPAEAAAELSKRWGCPFLITNGPGPAILASEGRARLMPVPSVKALNPTGSGDACAAGIALGLARGWKLEKACEYGLELGSRNAETLRPGRISG